VSVVVSDSRGCVVISTDVGDVRFTVSGKNAHDMRSKLDPWLGPASPERDAAKQEQEAQRGPVVAKFAPGVFGAIRVYQDGTIESRFGNGSVIGATARVDQSGSKRIFRDTRQVFLTIEGPRVDISVSLQSKNALVVGHARKFAATINKLAQQQTPATAPAPAPAEVSIPDQLGKLAELRDRGVLTEAEFEAKKTELLERM
jgi:hypothetical protein